MSRIVGWCAHRMEEIMTSNKIIRPAYRSVVKRMPYVSIDNRYTYSKDEFAASLKINDDVEINTDGD